MAQMELSKNGKSWIQHLTKIGVYHNALRMTIELILYVFQS
jgi:hypothetical protein